MTRCWICNTNEIPNIKRKYTFNLNGKKKQKTIRICSCCSACISEEDIKSRLEEC